MISLGQTPIFVIHYSKLVDREIFLKKIFTNLKVHPTWVTEKNFSYFKVSSQSRKKILGVSEKLVGMDLGINSRSLVYSRRKSRLQGYLLYLRSFIPKQNYVSVGSLPKKNRLPEAQIELQSMHLTALVAGIEKNSKWIFILEDDAIPASYAFENVNEILENVINKNTWINLNSGAGLVRTSSDKNPDSLGLFQVKPASIRCAVAYLVSIDLAKKIINSAYSDGVPDWLPIDVYYQVLLRKFKSITYWSDPPTFDQGSENGKYLSGLDKFRQ
jgi:hypothetical protein